MTYAWRYTDYGKHAKFKLLKVSCEKDMAIKNGAGSITDVIRFIPQSNGQLIGVTQSVIALGFIGLGLKIPKL
jgi:hypothetical protein